MTQAGDTVAGYQLVRVVGEGPFGVLWHAIDANGATLAVKLLKPAFIQRPAGQAAFTRLLATLRLQELVKHDGLARVYGPVQDPAHPAYGMAVEYVEGRLVSEIRMPTASDQEARSLSVVLAWFEELGELLALLHSQGIVHGNLKPTNVKLVRESFGHRIKLLDLPWSSIGLAAPQEGAPSYLAPEQLQGAPPSVYSDQWSLSKMLLDVLSAGRYRGGLAQLPTNLAMTIQRAQQPQPGFRFTQMMELVGALRLVRSELSPSIPGYGGYPGYGQMSPLGSVPGLVPSVSPPSTGPGAPPTGAPVSASSFGASENQSLGANGGAKPSVDRAEAPVAGIDVTLPPPTPTIPTLRSPIMPISGLARAPRPSRQEDDPVFVPTARHLETTASGSLPETGEFDKQEMFADMPMPTTAPVTNGITEMQLDGDTTAPVAGSSSSNGLAPSTAV
ncbi:MAG: protein kinase, partial [Myxococcota bacterium]